MSGFVGDEVEGFTPASFALELVRTLRKDKRTAHKPSLRMTLALPRFLTARYCRTRSLTPKDYLEAARVNTVPEDQHIAEEIARQLLFPDVEEKKAAAAKKAEAASQAATPTSLQTAAPSLSSATAGILGDLASLDLDLDNLDALDFDAIDAAVSEDDGAADVFELFERLYSSADQSERALAELVVTFGGPAELHGVGADTLAKVRGFAQASLLGTVGALSPEQVMYGCRAGFARELLHETRHPWELAGAMAHEGLTPTLQSHLDDVLGLGVAPRGHVVEARSCGAVMAFLRPYTKKPAALDGASLDALATQTLRRVGDLGDVAEYLIAAGEWYEVPQDLIDDSVRDNVGRALDAGRRIEQRFGQPMCAGIFDVWLAGLGHAPSMDELIFVAVDGDAWVSSLQESWNRHVVGLRDEVEAAGRAAAAAPPGLQDVVRLADALQRVGIEAGAKLATEMATDAVCLVNDAEHFLPLLDDFLARTIIPHDIERVIAAGTALGVDPHEIYDRLGDALEQLRGMILGNSHDVDRYKRLIDKIVHVPDEIMDACLSAAMGSSNLEAIAALLALDLGGVASRAPDEVVSAALGYKGIGDGTNLLKQWFTHRRHVRPELKAQIKAQVKDALLDLAFTWINSGDGDNGRGLIPQSQARPYRSGDELDALDLEATLDAIVSGGKGLDAVTADDLFVTDTQKGQAALSVLIDISGSMGGGELAMCAVAVVMLLGKVSPKEIALAVFESDTHVIKPFASEASLDEVADRVLDLEATGGTRVDAALTWAAEQFESVPEVDFRLLFLLSDFMFFEKPDELRRHGRRLGDAGVRLLAASHGYSDQRTIALMVDTISGQHVGLKSLAALPGILMDTLKQIGDGLSS